MEDVKQHSLLKGRLCRWRGVWCYPEASCPNKIVFADLDKIIKKALKNLFLVCGFLWREPELWNHE